MFSEINQNIIPKYLNLLGLFFIAYSVASFLNAPGVIVLVQVSDTTIFFWVGNMQPEYNIVLRFHLHIFYFPSLAWALQLLSDQLLCLRYYWKE